MTWGPGRRRDAARRRRGRALVLTVRALSARLAAAEAALARLDQGLVPLLADTRAALRRAETANHRTDALLDSATSVTETVDAAHVSRTASWRAPW